MKAFDYAGIEPFDERPWGPYVSRAERVEAIYDALSGVTLGDYDRRVTQWLSGLDNDTCRVLVGLFLRVGGPYLRTVPDTSADALASPEEIAAIKRREDAP